MSQPNMLPTVQKKDQVEITERLERYRDHSRGAFAPETERALQGDIRRFSEWCAERGVEPLPASPDTVMQYIDAMAEHMVPASVRRYVSSISKLHSIAEVSNPTQSQEVKNALLRMMRAKGTRQRQAGPLTREKLNRILNSHTGRRGRKLRTIRDLAMVCLAYDTLCRRSEIAAMNMDDLTFSDDGTGVVLIRRSKTDQFGEGSTRFIAKDTMKRLRRWLFAAHITAGAVFRGVDNADQLNDRISTMGIVRAFKRLAKRADLEAETISGHSCRVGGCQDMVSAGLEVGGIMQAGGWKTPIMVARYSQALEARRGAAAQLAKIQKRG